MWPEEACLRDREIKDSWHKLCKEFEVTRPRILTQIDENLMNITFSVKTELACFLVVKRIACLLSQGFGGTSTDNVY